MCKIQSQNLLFPPFERDILHYGKAQTDLTGKVINNFSWERAFKNLETNEMVHVFSKTIKNILYSFIPHLVLSCNDKDRSW